MRNSLNLMLLVLLVSGGAAQARNKRVVVEFDKAKTQQIANQLYSNCVTNAAEVSILNKNDVLAEVTIGMCKTQGLSREQLMDRTNPIMAAAQANLEEINVNHAQCIYSTLTGRMVEGPRDLKNVDLQEVMRAFQAKFTDKVPYESPCAPAFICNNSRVAEALETCHSFMDFDSLRRVAEMFGTAGYPGESKEPARDQATEAMRSVMEQAVSNMMIERGHLNLKNR